jgi:uncharacterized membrane protein YqjE
MSIETLIVLSPIIIALSILVVLIMLYQYPDIAIAMSYATGYILIAIFIYFFYRKSKEEENNQDTRKHY